MEETKAEKARKILSDKEIDKCCEWLLDYNGEHVFDVPGVTRALSSPAEKDAKICESLVFSYEGKTYDLRYENVRPSSIPWDDEPEEYGDFVLQVDSQVVLHTSVTKEHHEYGSTYRISTSIERAALGDWLEVIPRIVAMAQKVEADQKQQEKEAKTKELEDNIDLGEYE